jgi:hypothetical protein
MRASLSSCWEKPLGLSRILPRWRLCHRGVSVVTALYAVATEEDLYMSHSKAPTRTKLAHAKNGAKRPGKPGNIPPPVIRAGAKQDAFLTLLRQPKGTTIVDLRGIRTPLWSAPLRVDTDQAAVLPVCRMR